MRALIVGTVVCLLVAAAGADEPPLPKSLRCPSTALARAQVEGKMIAVVVKVVQTVPEIRAMKQVVHEPVEKEVNGKKETVLVPVERVFAFQVEVPKGFREVKLFAADVKARDAAGNVIPPGKLPTLLAAETPVLLAPTADPVDPFHLLTTKAGTVVLHIDPAKLAAPAPK